MAEYLGRLRNLTAADELITVHQAPAGEDRPRSISLLAEAVAAAA